MNWPIVTLIATLVITLAALIRLFVSYPTAPHQKSVLSRLEQALVLAVADAYFPPAGPIPISGSEAGALSYFDGWLSRSDRFQVILIRLLLVYSELSPLVFGPTRRRFTQLGHQDRLDFLQTCFTSRIYFRRVVFVSMRALLTMAYLADNDVCDHIQMKQDTDPFNLGDRPPIEIPCLAGATS